MASTNPFSDTVAMLGGAGSRDQVVQSVVASLGASNGSLSAQLMTIAQQLQQLQKINQAVLETMMANSQAVVQNSSTSGQTGDSTVSTIGKTLESVLGFGLGLSPLISGVMSLFGGGGGSQPAPLVPFLKPASVRVDAGISSSVPGTAFSVDSGQGGWPRAVSSSAPIQDAAQAPVVDSRWFLDHSQDIAMAVRQAMLESSALNDVIREA